MHVAILESSDAPQYRTLMLQAYALAADAFTSTAEERAAEPESWWVQRIADPHGMSAAFGAFEGGQLIGTVALEFSAKPKTKHKALVIGMYVSPSFRRSGAARALLAAAMAHARGRAGTLLLTLSVTEGNEPAIGLYRAAGFVEFGTEPMAILTPGGFKAKIHMWHRLAEANSAAASFRIIEVDPLGTDALALLREAAIEARELYPELHAASDPWPVNTPTPPRGVHLVAYLKNRPIAMGAHRPIDEESTEIRRMFVTRQARRSGAARAVLAALEAHARAQGFKRLVLETGRKQLAAMALYESCGFDRSAPFGAHVCDPTSVCYSRSLVAIEP